jgi:hypothetical protein
VDYLFDGLLTVMLSEALVAPVLVHFGVQKVLIDGREFGSEGDSKVLQTFSLPRMLAIVSGNQISWRS